MSSKVRAIKFVNHHVRNQYEELQAIIERETGIKCSVLVTPQFVSIRAASLADYYLAKSAIKGRVSVEVVQG